MNTFLMNGYLWKVEFVDPFDDMLVDRTGNLTVATTDPETFTLYFSNELYGDFFVTVLIHELSHCAMVSFHLLDDIQSFVREDRQVEAEEWICNFLADYGFRVFATAYRVSGYDAWQFIPEEFHKLISKGWINYERWRDH